MLGSEDSSGTELLSIASGLDDQESQAVWAEPGGFRVGIAEAERRSPLFGL